MNQEPALCAAADRNEVLVAVLYAERAGAREELARHPLEVCGEAHAAYYAWLCAAPAVLCARADYEAGGRGLAALARLPVPAGAAPVLVRYAREPSVGCAHQCAGCRARCAACGAESGCPACHDEAADHAFAFGGLRCRYCGALGARFALRCGGCGRAFAAAGCARCCAFADMPAAAGHVCADALCAVCQEPLCARRARALPCSHRLHLACLWALEARGAARCPACRAPWRDGRRLLRALHGLQAAYADVAVESVCGACGHVAEGPAAPLALCPRCGAQAEPLRAWLASGRAPAGGRAAVTLEGLAARLTGAEREAVENKAVAPAGTPGGVLDRCRLALELLALRGRGAAPAGG